MIKITITLKELNTGLMSLTADSFPDEATLAEAIAHKQISEDIIQVIKKISEKAKNSVYAEGDSANALRKVMEKGERGKDV